MDVIVTTGGTAESIDDVRAVTNFSTGRFGVAIAAALAERHDVTVLASREAGLHCDTAGLPHRRFTSAASLDALLDEELSASRDKVVIHSAAVADYAPIRADGKLSSDADEMTVTMRRVPKLVDTLRDRAGRTGFLVGFKLLSGVDVHDLWAAGRALMKRANLNLVVANDLAECRDGRHPVWLLTQEGGAIRLDGDRAMVAARIAAFIERRAAVTWSATLTCPGPGPQLAAATTAAMASALEWARDASLLPGTDGNVIVADPTGTLLVTPRQVDKSQVHADSCIVATVPVGSHQVLAWPPPATPEQKPSIDTSVTARILDRCAVSGFVHSHEVWGRASVATAFPYPCGAAEEATAVLDALGDIAAAPRFSVELAHHGFLLGFTRDTLPEWRAAWAAVRAGYEEHLAEVGETLDGVALRPIIDGADIVGVVAVTELGNAVWVDQRFRGRGVGSVVRDQLIRRQERVATVPACGVVEHWTAQGFTVFDTFDDQLVVLAPPPRVDDPVV